MNRIVESFIRDESFRVLKQTENYYIFKDQKTLGEFKVEILNDDKVNIEFKDHFNDKES